MTELKTKLSKHFSGFTNTIKYAFVFMFLIPFSVGHAYQFIAPASFFFEYGNPSMEIVSGNKVGETAEIRSNSNYYDSLYAEWWDSMYCDGVKRATQPWEDFIWKDKPKEDWEFWAYTFRERDKQCQICGKLRATTSRGYKKTQEYCSPFFDIER